MNKIKEVPNSVIAVLCCYLLPQFFLTLYGSYETSWTILSSGLLLTSLGTLICYNLLNSPKEIHIKPSDPQEETNSLEDLLTAQVSELEEQIQEYQTEIEKFKGESESKSEEFEQYKKDHELNEMKIEELNHELSLYKNNSDEDIRKKEVLLSEYQETITQQRSVIKKKQEQITELEGKVNDLKYEVKTLLDVAKLNEPKGENESTGSVVHDIASNYQIPPSPSSVTTPEDASLQLRRCIDIAQKITGAGHFENGNSKFREWQMNSYALDLRRLFDNLKSETACTIIVYSQKDNKLLFVNNEAKNMLGWSAEKFIHQFPEILQESTQEWNRAISRLATTLESSTRLFLKTRSGQNSLTNCHLGIIPSGIFRNYIIGILYTAPQADTSRT